MDVCMFSNVLILIWLFRQIFFKIICLNFDMTYLNVKQSIHLFHNHNCSADILLITMLLLMFACIKLPHEFNNIIIFSTTT